MAVAVSLLELVTVHGSRGVWPGDFQKLLIRCEEDYDDRVAFGVVADWCDQFEEPELAEAFRWMHNRPAVGIAVRRGGDHKSLYLTEPPKLLGALHGPFDKDTGLAGLMAELAHRLAELREVLAK